MAEAPLIHDISEQKEPKAYKKLGVEPALWPAHIRYKGVFDFQGLYKMMARWLKSRRFEFHENLYRLRGPELVIRWYADRKKNPFGRQIIEIDIDIRGYEEVEAVVNGVKKKLVSGRMTINFDAKVELAYPDIFGGKKWNSDLERKLLYFLRNFVVKRDVELLYIDALYYEIYKLHNEVREYMKFNARGNLY